MERSRGTRKETLRSRLGTLSNGFQDPALKAVRVPRSKISVFLHVRFLAISELFLDLKLLHGIPKTKHLV